MRMLYCTCNVAVLQKVQVLCEELHIKSYQVIDRVLSKNRSGDHRFNDEIWPGYSVILLFQFNDDDNCRRLYDALERYNDEAENPNERLTVCTWALDQYIY